MKKKVNKYKCFNITKEEIEAILAGQEQMRSDSECSNEDYAKWANTQIGLIDSFYKKIRIQ